MPLKIKRCKKCDRCHIVGDKCRTCARIRQTLWAFKTRFKLDKNLSDEEIERQYREYRRSIDRRWRENNPEKDKKRKRDHDRNRSWEQKSAANCNARAREKGLPRGMKPSDLYDLTGKLPEFCPIFPHIRLDYHQGPDRRCWASVDRKVPTLGYVTDNVWVVSMAANIWKSNGSNPEERKKIVALMTPKAKKQKIDPAQQSLF